MDADRPRISIVTPTLNRERFLGDAIESVLVQGYPNFEHIVVDGLSTDGTPELLARYPHLRVIREKDTGLYDALNKGIRIATGDVIAHLNSDDVYPAGVLARVMATFADAAVDVVSGAAEIQSPDGKTLQKFSDPDAVRFGFASATTGVPIPNARFFRRRVYGRVGEYDTQYRVAADRDFLFRVALTQPVSREVDVLAYVYRAHEESLTFGDDAVREAKWREEYLAIAEHYLAKTDLPDDARGLLRRWHERESAQAGTRALLRGEWGRCRDYATRGLRHNPAWPVMFARHLGGALLGR